MPDVNNELAMNIRHAKNATKEAPFWFAFVAKGTTDGVLLVSKKKIPSQEINKAKAACGGKHVFRGRCFGDGDQLIFEVGKEPPAILDKQVRGVIHRDAGLQLKVAFRVATDLATEEEGAESPAVQPPAPPPPPPPPPGPPGNGAAKFMARLKALLPDLQKAEAANHPLSQEVKLHAGEAQLLARNKDFEHANSVLDKLESLVKQVLAAPVAPLVPPEAPPTRPHEDGAARFTARLKALLPDLQKAEARTSPLSQELKLRASAAQTSARTKDFVQANAILDQVEKLVEQILAGAHEPPGPAPTGISLVKLGRARVEWIATRTRALGDINRLKTAIEREFKNDTQQQAQLGAALARLDSIFVQLNEDLGNQLDDVLNEKDPTKRRELSAVAKDTMTRFLQYIDSDTVVAELDGNEVVPAIQIAAPVRARLQEIAVALGQ